MANPHSADRAETSKSRDASALPRLEKRVRSLAIYRAASRAISPSLRAAASSLFNGSQLHRTLELLSARVAKLEPYATSDRAAEMASIVAELGRVDHQLTKAGQKVRKLVRGIPLAQLRSTLPDIASRRRVDVLALLETLLRDPAAIVNESQLFDYLVTLLCTDEDRGRRYAPLDPAGLLPRMRALCDKASAVETMTAATAERDFYAAASACEDARLDELICEMREKKRKLGQDIFVPAVLRALVTYNVAVGNKLQETFEAEPEPGAPYSGLETLLAAEETVETDSAEAEDWAGSLESVEPAEGSIFDSHAIQNIAIAIHSRLEASSVTPGAVRRIADRANLSLLGSAERELLESVAGDDPLVTVLSLLVTAGLLLSSLLESMLDLREVGIDPNRLREVWIPQLDEQLEEIVDSMIASGSREKARAIWDMKTKFIYPRA